MSIDCHSQEVKAKVKVQSTDGDDKKECILQAVDHPLVVTGQIELDFKVFKNGGSTASKVKDYKKVIIYLIVDTFHEYHEVITHLRYTTKDGDDNDYHDTTLVVSLIKE
ncbi:hypothetical protein AZE42_06864 [Rhizopogon vesiculosus]|uniref:Uncharacterized protein n=1 Tax=Rhizopogon vesiculosus TaxID=180088 RepID=A0A1J8PZK6_9AGAM|nr:hypothetical protein AZE42_06864 [Rhizopogon vesiculosus]